MALDPVGLTGLIIALVALFVASLQMLQALLATADGYRNCRSAIMGEWASSGLRRRNFVWKEMRYETSYTVPYLTIGVDESINPCYIDGEAKSRSNTHCKAREPGEWQSKSTTSDMVTWFFLLDQLHMLGLKTSSFLPASKRDSNFLRPLPTPALHAGRSDSSTNGGDPKSQAKQENSRPVPPWLYPNLVERKRSWDFQPADINKPLAVSNLGSVAVIARRLGMIWVQFQPSESLLRAEGNGMIIESTRVPSVGTIIQFSRVEKKKYEPDKGELYCPIEAADMLGFGIVKPWYKPGDLSGQDNLYVGTNEECIQTMTMLCGQSPATERLKKSIKDGNWTPGFSDIVPLAAPIMYTKQTGINRIPKPSHYVMGLTVYSQAFRVFHKCLEGYIAGDTFKASSSEATGYGQLRKIEEACDYLHSTGRWDGQGKSSSTNDEDVKTLDSMADRLRDAEVWLTEEFPKLAPDTKLGYADLLRCHLECAVWYKHTADDMIKGKDTAGIVKMIKEVWTVDLPDDIDLHGDGRWIVVGMFKYFDYATQSKTAGYMYDLMRQRGYAGPPSVLATAWFTMMFRAFCWQRIHYMVPGSRVGSQHWNSRLPIYIT